MVQESQGTEIAILYGVTALGVKSHDTSDGPSPRSSRFHLRQRRLGLLEPESHVHGPVQVDSPRQVHGHDAVPGDHTTLSPMLSLRVAYWRPHRVPRRVLLVRVGGAKNGRLVKPLGHNLEPNGQRVPGEAAGDGYRGNTGEGGGGREGEMP